LFFKSYRPFLEIIENAVSNEDKIIAWTKYILFIVLIYILALRRYAKWSHEAFPSTSTKTLEVLEKGTTALYQIEELKNDPRHVKLWIEYV
jgi:hypothetical protein